MANLLKVNVTVEDLCQVHGMAHRLKSLGQHLRFDNTQVEITVDDAVNGDQIAALDESIATLKASSDDLETAVRNATDSPTH